MLSDIFLRALLEQVGGRGQNAALSTLIFHRVLPEQDPLLPGEMYAARFKTLCGWINTWFNVLSLDEAVERLRRGCLPPRACVLTFDDGYADNFEIALPILREARLSATFFVANGFLDGGRMWNDTVIEAIRRCPNDHIELVGTPAAALGTLDVGDLEQRLATINLVLAVVKSLDPAERVDWVDALAERSAAILPEDLMMSSSQVRGLREAGMQIGAHTLSHPILARLSRREAEREIAGSRDSLEALLRERVGLFAYPNGKPGVDYSPEHREIVKSLGFDAAVSTAWGVATRQTDPLQIPRFTPWDTRRWLYALRMARNLYCERAM